MDTSIRTNKIKPSPTLAVTAKAAELKAAGMSFKPINDKGNGKFIVAKAGDDVMSIPCGKSVTDEHTTQECSFGLTTKDNTLVAYAGGSEWL